MAVSETKASYPSWLDLNFLEKALNSEDRKNVKVEGFNVSRATNFGDNYSSDIYRLQLQVKKNGKEENMSLILKVELVNNELSKLVSVMNAFERESNTFKIIPKMESMLLNISPTKYKKYAANCFYTKIGAPNSIILMEDLKEMGFKLADSTSGLDTNHCILIAKHSAHYHAASVALHQRYPDIFEPFSESCYSEASKEHLQKIFSPLVKSLAIELETWPDFKDKFAEKLHFLADNCMDILIRCVQTEDNEFKVLCHDDLWLNNMMFKYAEDTGEPIDIRYIDFQLTHWNSPAIDLLYALNTCASVDILKSGILLDEYYITLKDTLTDLGLENLVPTKEELNKSLQEKCLFGVLLGICSRFMIMAEKDKKPDFNKIMNNEASVYFSDKMKEAMKELLMIYDQKKWI